MNLWHNDPAYLRAYARRHYALNGEDGLLDYMLRCLPHRDGWCVEFGAWDGVYLSNTYHLIRNRNARGVLIEADPDKYRQLQENMHGLPVTCLQRMVGAASPDNLDSILRHTRIPEEFDLLSIDVDGDDYHIWKALTHYRPKVVVIELCTWYLPDTEHIHVSGSPYEHGVSGSSATSMTRLAESKGYRLVLCIGSNAVYVRDPYYRLFHSRSVSVEEVFAYDQVPLDRLDQAQRARHRQLLLMRPLATLARSAVQKVMNLMAHVSLSNL